MFRNIAAAGRFGRFLRTGFRYEPLPSPAALKAGKNVVILSFYLLLHLFYHTGLDAEVMGDADGMALVDRSAVKRYEVR